MWVSPKRRERGKGVWGVRPFLLSYSEDPVYCSSAKQNHGYTYYIFSKSVIPNIITTFATRGCRLILL